ncbi:MAG: tetratricopeptide repeat protein [Rhodoferax sp.]|uniref:nuclear transport factor 2 family protein n=1 Tax=Rhodoferax sp. TaxID=50421 RepID=UPI002ACDBF00|nr:tetratricopeptide repeat protein [Rhodoferax sp.]MDZ7892015.1 tetratricopeptide repeat protein [Rhodoferax sp.]
MKQAPSPLFSAIRWVALAATLSFGVAHADDYADVAQLVRNGKLPEAMAKADQYLAAKPRDPQMRFLKGVIQRDSGKNTDAIATFTRLTEDYPELPEPYNNLAVLYAGQSQFDKARTALEMAIRTNPSYTTAHENLGDVYAKLASQAYGKALQLDANNAAVPPKLALIRELFNPATAKGQRPASTLSAPTPVAPPPVAAPAKPAPEPVVSKPAAPAVPAANATPAQTATAAAAPAAQPKAEPASGADARKDVETAVRNWAKAWAARDMKGYLSAYGRDFDTPGGVKRSAWEEERRQRITGKSKIMVTISNLNITVNGSKATAKFRQDYKANELAVSSRKVLELTKTGDRWLIVRESVGN